MFTIRSLLVALLAQALNEPESIWQEPTMLQRVGFFTLLMAGAFEVEFLYSLETTFGFITNPQWYHYTLSCTTIAMAVVCAATTIVCHQRAEKLLRQVV